MKDKIKKLRQKMEAKVETPEDLQDEEVQQISRKLDQLIVDYIEE